MIEEPREDATTALAFLRRFTRRRVVREQCDLCGAEIPTEHAHLLELPGMRLHCACEGCAFLLGNQETGKFRLVPRQIRFLTDFRLTDEQWASLHLPIDLAFFLHSTPAERIVAYYPSPAGPTESLPALEAWQALAEENPILRELKPDVEALLVNRLGGAREYYLLGIDECFRLVGLIRTHWRGLSGGAAVWEEIRRFFSALRARSSRIGDTAHA